MIPETIRQSPIMVEVWIVSFNNVEMKKMERKGDRKTNELIFSGEDEYLRAVIHKTKVIPISKQPT